CQGWQQFVFDASGFVFMQYWLLKFSGGCPIGWTPSNGDCYRNSFAKQVPFQATVNAQMALTAVATPTMDTVILTTNGGDLHAVGANTVLDLQPAWNTAEFNVFGDANGSKANINAGSTIVVRTAITDGTINAPTCLTAGTTGETNSLD